MRLSYRKVGEGLYEVLIQGEGPRRELVRVRIERVDFELSLGCESASGRVEADPRPPQAGFGWRPDEAPGEEGPHREEAGG